MQWTVDSAEMEVRTKMQPEEYVSAFESLGTLLNTDPVTACSLTKAPVDKFAIQIFDAEFGVLKYT
jgi:hypothetical protein